MSESKFTPQDQLNASITGGVNNKEEIIASLHNRYGDDAEGLIQAINDGLDLETLNRFESLLKEKVESLSPKSLELERERKKRVIIALEAFVEKAPSMFGSELLPDYLAVSEVMFKRDSTHWALKADQGYFYFNPQEVEVNNGFQVDPKFWFLIDANGASIAFRPMDKTDVLEGVEFGLEDDGPAPVRYMQAGTLRTTFNETAVGSFLHSTILNIDIKRVGDAETVINYQARNSGISKDQDKFPTQMRKILTQIQLMGYPVVSTLPSDDRRKRIFQAGGMIKLSDDFLIGFIDKLLK